MHVVERVPHGSNDLRHFAEAGARVLTFDGRLCVAEKQRIRRHRPETIHTDTRPLMLFDLRYHCVDFISSEGGL